MAVRAGRRGRPRGVRGVRGVPPRAAGDAPDRAPDPPRLGSRARAAPLGRAAVVDRAASGSRSLATEARGAIRDEARDLPGRRLHDAPLQPSGGPAVRRSEPACRDGVVHRQAADRRHRDGRPGRRDLLADRSDLVGVPAGPCASRARRRRRAPVDRVVRLGRRRRRDLRPRRVVAWPRRSTCSASLPQRVTFMDLVAAQVRDCGIELDRRPGRPARRSSARSSSTRTSRPEEDTPFDALFIGWAHAFDPDEQLFHSRWVSSEEQPDGLNVMGYRGSARRRAARPRPGHLRPARACPHLPRAPGRPRGDATGPVRLGDETVRGARPAADAHRRRAEPRVAPVVLGAGEARAPRPIDAADRRRSAQEQPHLAPPVVEALPVLGRVAAPDRPGDDPLGVVAPDDPRRSPPLRVAQQPGRCASCRPARCPARGTRSRVHSAFGRFSASTMPKHLVRDLLQRISKRSYQTVSASADSGRSQRTDATVPEALGLRLRADAGVAKLRRQLREELVLGRRTR